MQQPVCTLTALYTRTVVSVQVYTTVQATHVITVHCTQQTTLTGHTEIYRLAHRIFPRSYLQASDNDDHWPIKRKSHTGFTFL